MKKAKRYPNLHQVEWTPNWVFRKYSSTKGREFVKSTGIAATEKNAAAAHKRGRDLFDEWLGLHLESGRQYLIRDIAKALKAAKASRKPKTLKSFSEQVDNHINPHFGHLRPDQITSLRWETYDAEERKRIHRKRVGGRVYEYRRTKLFNTRKALIEILHRAEEEGMIRRVPDLKNFDPPAEPPKYLDFWTYRAIRRATPWPLKLLPFIMYWQGPRPSEALQYEYPFIRWSDDDLRPDGWRRTWPRAKIRIPGEITKTGRPRTIPLNSRVARALRWMARHKKNLLATRWLFPSRTKKGQPILHYNAVWARALAKAGLEDLTIYNLRDTFITNRLREGLSSTFVAKYVDSSSEMIDRKYAVAEEEVMGRVAG